MEDNKTFIEKMMELGIGMSMIQQMPAMIDGCMPKPMATSSQPTGQYMAPPPITPPMSVYLAIDNTQAGPFGEDDLIKLIANNLLTSDTLVWKQGMSQWAKASQVPEVNRLFIMAKIR